MTLRQLLNTSYADLVRDITEDDRLNVDRILGLDEEEEQKARPRERSRNTQALLGMMGGGKLGAVR